MIASNTMAREHLTIVIALLFLGSEGLQITLKQRLPSESSGCVLICDERSSVTLNNSVSVKQDDLSLPGTTVSTISTLAIYRDEQTSSNNNNRRHTLIASVTSQQPILSRDSDGTKVAGYLTAQQASLSLELVKKEDCQAEYTCEVRGVSTQGKELVSTSHLQQPPSENRGQDDGGSWTPGSALKFIGLVQRLDTTQAQLGQSLVNGVKSNRLEHEIEQSKNNVVRLENKINQLESKIDLLNRSLMYNIESLLRPTVCMKGMPPVVSQVSYNYAVIYPKETDAVTTPYLCDTVTDGGGWVVIQRRINGDVDFYRDWATYKKGFGSISGDFWLGNDNIHNITSQGSYELRVDLKYQGKAAFAHYSNFSIGDEQSNYILNLGSYDGTAGDSLTYHNGMLFSTHNNDHDITSGNCAISYGGAWWYENCLQSNLNGKWGSTGNKGPSWSDFSGSNPVSYSEMKVRAL